MPDQDVLMKPGGQLIYCLSGHQGSVVGLDIRGDGKVAVTCKYVLKKMLSNHLGGFLVITLLNTIICG